MSQADEYDTRKILDGQTADGETGFKIPEVKFLQVSAAASMSPPVARQLSFTCRKPGRADIRQYEQAGLRGARRYVPRSCAPHLQSSVA